MNAKMKSLMRKQVFEVIESGRPFPASMLSEKIRGLRRALGLTQRQMASKLGIKTPSYLNIEKNAGSAKIGTISKVLEKIGCSVMFSIKPSEPFLQMIKKRAAVKAARILGSAYSNMAMEEQSPSKAEYEKRLRELTEELSENPDSGLWE